MSSELAVVLIEQEGQPIRARRVRRDILKRLTVWSASHWAPTRTDHTGGGVRVVAGGVAAPRGEAGGGGGPSVDCRCHPGTIDGGVRVEDAVVPERGEESGGAMLRQVLPLAADEVRRRRPMRHRGLGAGHGEVEERVVARDVAVGRDADARGALVPNVATLMRPRVHLQRRRGLLQKQRLPRLSP